jgi:hypothetical protein
VLCAQRRQLHQHLLQILQILRIDLILIFHTK